MIRQPTQDQASSGRSHPHARASLGSPDISKRNGNKNGLVHYIRSYRRVLLAVARIISTRMLYTTDGGAASSCGCGLLVARTMSL